MQEKFSIPQTLRWMKEIKHEQYKLRAAVPHLLLQTPASFVKQMIDYHRIYEFQSVLLTLVENQYTNVTTFTIRCTQMPPDAIAGILCYWVSFDKSFWAMQPLSELDWNV